MDPDLQFDEIGAPRGGMDELLGESRWNRLIDRLLAGHRLRTLLVVAAAVLTVATFGGTRTSPGDDTIAATPPDASISIPAAPTPAAPADINVCTYEWVYVEDPNQPGVRPYETLYCPPRPAGHPVRTG